MMDEVLFNKTNIPVLLKSLDAGMLRSKVISNNVANINTPGYKRVEVSFESELRNALNRTKLKGTKTDPSHLDLGRKDISAVNAQIRRPNDPTLPSGVNNVDIDEEMAKLAENQILFNFSNNAIKGVFRKINSAIQARSIPVQ